MRDSAASIPGGRAQLARLISSAPDVISIEDAMAALGVDRVQASKALARWSKQGWLRRVGPGRYIPVPLDSLQSAQVMEDPWILVPVLFAPAYIGGRTAAEHWDLTEQIFRDIVVLTAQQVRTKEVEQQGAAFSLKHVSETAIFGTKTLWRGRTKIQVSDIHRTIIDMLDDPAIGGGIQHVDDCFAAYLDRPDRDLDRLISYADRLGNGAVFKRLGFLSEHHPAAEPLIPLCRSRLSKGNAKLDPVLRCPRLVTRWRLFVPESWLEGEAQ